MKSEDGKEGRGVRNLSMSFRNCVSIAGTGFSSIDRNYYRPGVGLANRCILVQGSLRQDALIQECRIRRFYTRYCCYDHLSTFSVGCCQVFPMVRFSRGYGTTRIWFTKEKIFQKPLTLLNNMFSLFSGHHKDPDNRKLCREELTNLIGTDEEPV